ncbi:hypothetical protein [uncultured Metabacillus sp.]|uniref:hypothetical protein n=1 Tax=uncultured Metabacillus sp. TaxID=2860135 RepID=UPI00262076C1|nr:hypothetical protein [uncultured Metabacillus sp.]
MKKIAVSLLMFMLVFTSFSGSIFAKENFQKEKVIYQKTEIKDVNKLFERAQKNISDIDESKKSLKLEAALTKTGENESNNIDLKSTTQLLKVAEKEDGTTVETYAMTVL